MSTIKAQVVDPQEFIDILDYEFLGDNGTVENKREFIQIYRHKASIYHAAQAVRVARSTIYRWIDDDPQFAQAVAEAREDSDDILESSVYERAFKDNLLAMFYLKAHRPKFRDKVQVDVEALHQEIESIIANIQPKQIEAITTEFINGEYQVQQPLTMTMESGSNSTDNLAGNSAYTKPDPSPLDLDQKEDH